MNILITAGGTQEPIDSVRSITNHATGKLGAMIADAFGDCNEVSQVVYVCGKTAVLPETGKAKIVRVGSTADLEQALGQQLMKVQPKVIVHCMAVSDYRVRQVTTVSDLQQVNCDLAQLNRLDSGGKISSSMEDLAILLEKTPKVIAMLRGLAPESVIVGFKLLDNVSEGELLATAKELLEANDCDFVLANDMKTVCSPVHCGYLLSAAGDYDYYEGKVAISEGIVQAALGKAAQK